MSANELHVTVKPDGTIAAIHNDALAALYEEGKAEVKRASHVEPVNGGEQVNWVADMSPIAPGVVLGPFRLRSEALAAEVEWLKQNLF
jgi:hypothetical protein